jgi:hypothetical protein
MRRILVDFSCSRQYQKRGGKARHVELEETAEVLEVSPRTVLREWSLAQASLHRDLDRGKRNEA